MSLQLFGFLNDDRLRFLLIFALVLIGVLIAITALIYPDITRYDYKSPPSEYSFYRGYCDSRTNQCASMHDRDPLYDCSYLCQICSNIGETAYNNCINS